MTCSRPQRTAPWLGLERTSDPVIHGEYEHTFMSCHCSENFHGLVVYRYFLPIPSQLNGDVILKRVHWLCWPWKYFLISGEFTMRALILPVPAFIRNETRAQYNGRLSTRTCHFNLAADQTSNGCVGFK